MDPDSGAKPPEGGASAAAHVEGRSSRRRKAKRHGKQRDAARASGTGSADSPNPAGRPQSPEQEQPARKRKRRRAKSTGKPPQVSQAAAGSVAIPGQNARPSGEAEQASGQNSGKSRNRRKKNRGGRGLQGRPLTPTKTSPGAAKAPSAGAGQPKDVRGRTGEAHAEVREKPGFVNDL